MGAVGVLLALAGYGLAYQGFLVIMGESPGLAKVFTPGGSATAPQKTSSAPTKTTTTGPTLKPAGPALIGS